MRFEVETIGLFLLSLISLATVTIVKMAEFRSMEVMARDCSINGIVIKFGM